MSLNKVMIIGRLGQDPELKYTPGGDAVCNFSVATSDKWTDKAGQQQEKTEWHRVVAWKKLAELCNQYLSKGRQSYIEGKLTTRSWDDKDGNKRYTTEIKASTVQFLGGNQNQNDQQVNQHQASNNQDGAPKSQQETYPDSNFASDDIPF